MRPRRRPPRGNGRSLLAVLILAGLFSLAGLGAGALAIYTFDRLGPSSASAALTWPLWWLLNDTPPAIAAGAPAGPQRGLLTVVARVDPPTRAALVGATLDGAPVPVTGSAGATGVAAEHRLEIDTSSLADGPHLLRIEGADHSRRRNRVAQDVPFTSDNTAPRLQLDASAGRLRAGSVVVVRWSADEPADLRATWSGGDLPSLAAGGGTSDGERRFSLVAVAVDAPAVLAEVQLAGVDPAGNVSRQALPLPVDAVPAPRQLLVVPPALAGLATGPVATAEAAQLAALTGPITPQRRWSGAFQSPLPAGTILTTGFGDRRDYADGHVAYHAGYDLAAPAGAPARASADGTVVFVGQLPQRGNAVVVDHGWGIYTVYGHLSGFDVEAGAGVAAGQVVGRVGSTGLSTGPHLHWEVRLRGVAVEPTAWMALSAELATPVAAAR